MICYTDNMLNLNSLMVGSMKPTELAAFYEKVLGRPADMSEQDWYGWQVGGAFLGIGKHSDVSEKSPEPARIMFNFETADVQGEFDRIKACGAHVVKEPYDAGNSMMIATFEDPDGNFFQLMSPWEEK